MRFPIEDVERIKKEFQKEQCFTEPYREYVNGCGISKVCLHNEDALEDEKDDLCIVVTLIKPIPENLALPSEYKGVRVYTKVVGEIRLHGEEEFK